MFAGKKANQFRLAYNSIWRAQRRCWPLFFFFSSISIPLTTDYLRLRYISFVQCIDSFSKSFRIGLRYGSTWPFLQWLAGPGWVPAANCAGGGPSSGVGGTSSKPKRTPCNKLGDEAGPQPAPSSSIQSQPHSETRPTLIPDKKMGKVSKLICHNAW
jgi:hypothetical protein